jgi:hypothetical protein
VGAAGARGEKRREDGGERENGEGGGLKVCVEGAKRGKCFDDLVSGDVEGLSRDGQGTKEAVGLVPATD